MKRSTKHLVEKVAVGIAAIGATFLGMKKYEQKREADKAAKAGGVPMAVVGIIRLGGEAVA